MDDNVKLDLDPSLIRDFLDEALDSLREVDVLLVQLEENPEDQGIINTIFRPVHSIKGNSPFFGFSDVRHLAHDTESLLSLIRNKQRYADKEIISTILRGVDELKQMLRRLHEGLPEVVDQESFEKLLTDINTESKRNAGKKIVQESAERQRIVGEEKAEAKKETHKTMRVSEEHIDGFLAYVGELLIVGEMLTYLETRVSTRSIDANFATEFRRLNEAFLKLSNDLQKSIMTIRKVPVRQVTQKASRLVRDIAVASGKQIKVEVVGDDLDADKSIVELLDAPYAHIVRNAADHGIEAPAVRQTQGKSPEGNVKIEVSQEDLNLVIKVSDDGAGLNCEGILQKALKLGLVSPSAKLSNEEIKQLIFLPGISTASVITDVSGRGVGMDVVKQTIDAAGGTILVTSNNGVGTAFEMRVPTTVTTQIMNGFVIEVSGQSYVVQLERVLQIVDKSENGIQTIVGEIEYIEHMGEVIPVVDLLRRFGIERLNQKLSDKKLFVVIESNKQRWALRVDGLIGVQQIVVKNMELAGYNQELFTGSAIMGDGRVGLVIDLDKLVSDSSVII